MGAEATRLALSDAGLDYSLIQQAYVGYVYGTDLRAACALLIGMTGILVINVNNNCSTGSTGLFLARARPSNRSGRLRWRRASSKMKPWERWARCSSGLAEPVR